MAFRRRRKSGEEVGEMPGLNLSRLDSHRGKTAVLAQPQKEEMSLGMTRLPQATLRHLSNLCLAFPLIPSFSPLDVVHIMTGYICPCCPLPLECFPPISLPNQNPTNMRIQLMTPPLPQSLSYFNFNDSLLRFECHCYHKITSLSTWH